MLITTIFVNYIKIILILSKLLILIKSYLLLCFFIKVLVFNIFSI